MSRIPRFKPLAQWITAGGLAASILVLAIDKLWDYQTRQAEISREERIRAEDNTRAAERQAQEESARKLRELREQRFHEEQLEAIRQREETVARLFSEFTQQVEIERLAKPSIKESIPDATERGPTRRTSGSPKDEDKAQFVADSFSKTRSVENVGSIAIKSVFAGERIDLCGYRGFSVTPIDSGSRFEMTSSDRSIPEREFSGWRRTIAADTPLLISRTCEVTVSSEQAGGNTIIYFKIKREK